jgi:hypothetical protein
MQPAMRRSCRIGGVISHQPKSAKWWHLQNISAAAAWLAAAALVAKLAGEEKWAAARHQKTASVAAAAAKSMTKSALNENINQSAKARKHGRSGVKMAATYGDGENKRRQHQAKVASRS